MQKWEYLWIVYDDTEDKKRKVRYINGEEVPNWFAGNSFYQTINDLGEKGWELVDLNVARLAFRRPKIEQDHWKKL